MNRTQFFIATGLSSILALLLICHIFLSYSVNKAQVQWSLAQEFATQGNVSQQGLNVLARRILGDASRTNDQGLKDLVTKYQIQVAGQATNSTETPATPPAPTH